MQCKTAVDEQQLPYSSVGERSTLSARAISLHRSWDGILHEQHRTLLLARAIFSTQMGWINALISEWLRVSWRRSGTAAKYPALRQRFAGGIGKTCSAFMKTRTHLPQLPQLCAGLGERETYGEELCGNLCMLTNLPYRCEASMWLR